MRRTKKLKRIRTEPVVPVYKELIQCERKIPETPHNPNWRKEHYLKRRPEWDHKKCQHGAVFCIGGEFLCKTHAGQKAIKLIESGDYIPKPKES